MVAQAGLVMERERLVYGAFCARALRVRPLTWQIHSQQGKQNSTHKLRNRGYEEYCEARVCGYYVNAPRCQGTVRDYYVDGKLGLS